MYYYHVCNTVWWRLMRSAVCAAKLKAMKVGVYLQNHPSRTDQGHAPSPTPIQNIHLCNLNLQSKQDTTTWLTDLIFPLSWGKLKQRTIYQSTIQQLRMTHSSRKYTINKKGETETENKVCVEKKHRPWLWYSLICNLSRNVTVQTTGLTS